MDDMALHVLFLFVRGPLLAFDGKNVVAQTFTSVLRAKVVVPPSEEKPDQEG